MKIKKCNKCNIAKMRRNRVIGRGSIPADILFLGEAPGKSEDLLGMPFIGQSGKLLERLIENAAKMEGLKGMPSYYITNTLLCRPYIVDPEADNYLENREPTSNEIVNCMPLITDIIDNIDPKFIIFVGVVAENYYKKLYKDSIRILHPAYLLRNGGLNSPYYLTTVRILQDVFKFISKNYGDI